MPKGEEVTATNSLGNFGLFSQLGYLSASNDPYVDPKRSPFCESHHSGKQFIASGTKKGKDTSDVYFSKQALSARVFQGESYSDPIARERRRRNDGAKANLGSPFKPSSYPAKPSGSGSVAGTFSGNIPATSPLQALPRKHKAPGRNFITSPGKKGTGYGYTSVTIGNPHNYIPDTYDGRGELERKERNEHRQKVMGKPFVSNFHPGSFFDKDVHKNDGGAGSGDDFKKNRKLPLLPFKPSHPSRSGYWGCFNNYPTNFSVAIKPGSAADRQRPKTTPAVFMPNGTNKTMPTRSIVYSNVPMRPNAGLATSYM